MHDTVLPVSPGSNTAIRAQTIAIIASGHVTRELCTTLVGYTPGPEELSTPWPLTLGEDTS